MHYGIEVVPFGDFSHPQKIVDLAQAAEVAGWEGLWIWDHMLIPFGVADPWITLAAVATVTTSIKLCVGVSPLPRYRPHLMARTANMAWYGNIKMREQPGGSRPSTCLVAAQRFCSSVSRPAHPADYGNTRQGIS